MKRWLRWASIFSILAFSPLIVRTQQAPASAPIPPAILSAKTVFLSNAGADSGLFPHPFSGSESRAYDELYATLTTWGHYTLIDDPAKADLVFEIQLTAPNGPANVDKQKGASDPLPMFRLTIFDRKTHYILWALTSSINPAALQKTHDRNFDDSLNFLVTGLKTLLAN